MHESVLRWTHAYNRVCPNRWLHFRPFWYYDPAYHDFNGSPHVGAAHHGCIPRQRPCSLHNVNFLRSRKHERSDQSFIPNRIADLICHTINVIRTIQWLFSDIWWSHCRYRNRSSCSPGYLDRTGNLLPAKEEHDPKAICRATNGVYASTKRCMAAQWISRLPEWQ